MTRDYWITRVFLLGVVALSACTTSEWTAISGGDTHLKIREVFPRNDAMRAAFTTSDATYVFSPTEVQAEFDALLAALGAAKEEGGVWFSDISVVAYTPVSEYSREQVFEVEYPDGMLQVGWRAGRHFYAGFRVGKELFREIFASSQEVDAAWRALGVALQRESKGKPFELRGMSLLTRMRSIGFESG